LARRLGNAADTIASLPIAQLAILPAILYSVTFVDGHSMRHASIADDDVLAAAASSRELVLVRAAMLPLTLLGSPLPMPLCLAFIEAGRSALRHSCRCLACRACCRGGGASAAPIATAPSCCVEALMAILASVVAYTVGALVTALPMALLVPACLASRGGASSDESGLLLVAFGASLFLALALNSLLFAKRSPRAVISLAALTLMLLCAVAYESFRKEGWH
jgi:hypothetical protein